MFLLSAVLALGCENKGGDVNTTDEVGETDDSKATDTSADTDDSKATDTSADTDDLEPTDSSADTDDLEPTETSSDTDEPLPAGCSETDPQTNAEFSVLIDGQFASQALDVACTVDAVEIVDTNSVTRLTCDDEGTALAVELRLAVAPEGDVSWAAGESVTLKWNSVDDFESEQHLQLRRADDTLLAAAFSAGEFNADIFAPIAVKYIPACGPWDIEAEEAASYQLDLELEGQPPLSLFSGNRGELPIGAGESFAVDVETAKYNECCHDSSETFWLLVRRVKAG